MKSKNARKKKRKNALATIERASSSLTTWIGSPASLIVHTLFFVGAFLFYFFGAPIQTVLLVLTTVVSLEAIYLSILIQMTVNRNTSQLDEVVEDIEEIQEDVQEIEKDVDEIQEDVEGIEKDVDEIQKDVDEIQEDVQEIEKDDEEEKVRDQALLEKIEGSLNELMNEINQLKKKK